MYDLTKEQRRFLLECISVMEENLQYNDEESEQERDENEKSIAECRKALHSRQKSLYR